MGYTQLQNDGLVSVLVTRGRDGLIKDCEVVDGRFDDTAVTLYTNQQILVGYVNGGDSLDESSRFAREPVATWDL